jgi:hypothetical protein
MDGTGTHPDVKLLLLQYLRRRSLITCVECSDDLNLPPIFQEYAISQDVIGWDKFVMGMISNKLIAIQSTHFHTTRKSYCATRWIRGLITQLLQVAHMQWIYRCVLVHHRTTEVLILANKAKLLKEIEHQLAHGPEGLQKRIDFYSSAILTISHLLQANTKDTGY